MRDWKRVILNPQHSMEDAIKVLNKGIFRIVLVIDSERKLLGTITDGDIRRALIKRFEMNVPVSMIMFTEPTTANVGDDQSTILSMMKSRDLYQVPILDKDGIIVGLETLHNLLEPKTRDNPVILMAGGFGKRLEPLTHDTPKPLLKVGGKPILETILLQFIEFGFHNFYISTHYKAEMLRSYFCDGARWGVNIKYVHEEKPLGTAGALALLPQDLGSHPIIMMNGDLLTKVNFEHLLEFHVEHGCRATICGREHEFQIPYGVIEQKEGRVLRIVEKPVQHFFVNAGIYVLEPGVIEDVKVDTYLDMPTLLERQLENGYNISTFPMHEYWLDIGRLEEFERANGEINEVFP